MKAWRDDYAAILRENREDRVRKQKVATVIGGKLGGLQEDLEKMNDPRATELIEQLTRLYQGAYALKPIDQLFGQQ